MINSVPNKTFSQADCESAHLAPAVRAATSWIEDVLKVDLPMNGGFRNALVSGEILCCLLNTIIPGAIKRINRCPNRAAASDNLSLFLNACETKCGISKSRLFDIDNFEDIFDRKSESLTGNSRAIKNSEKVVITIFWLAKFVDQNPQLSTFPKLDYTAFANLLPGKLAQVTNSGCAENNSRLGLSGRSFSSVASSGYTSAKFSQHVPRSVLMGNNESLPLRQNTTRTSSLDSNPVGYRPRSITSPVRNTDVTSFSKPDRSITNVPSSVTQTVPTPVVQQQNNNGTDEDDWQANLDAWRERRRRLSRLQATTLTSFEQIRQEEEKRKQEAARDRLRQIITQHTILSNPYLPSTSVVHPFQEPMSAGLAILTGKAHENFDFQTDVNNVPHSAPPTGNFSRITTTTPTGTSQLPTSVTKEIVLVDSERVSSPLLNGHAHLPTSAHLHNSVDQPTASEQQSVSISESTSENGLLSGDDYQEIHLRLQSKPKSTEVRWGLTLTAKGSSQTAPFVVKQVKMGSTADLCDMSRGDVLIRVNHREIGPGMQSAQKSINLSELEDLLDHLSKSGQPVNMHILRKRCNLDDDLDEENSECSLIDTQQPIQSPSPTTSKDETTSDVDEQSAAGTALVIPRSPFRAVNSIQLVKQLSHELSHVSSDQPRSTLQKQFESNSPRIAKTYEIESFATADASSDINNRETPSLTQPLRDLHVGNSLSTRMLETAEVGTSRLRTPSQVEEAVNSRSITSSHNVRHAEIGNAEPTYLSIVGNHTQQSGRSNIVVKKPSFGDPCIVAIEPSCSLNPIDSITDLPVKEDSTPPLSPLPPPPPLPILPDPHENLLLHKMACTNGLNAEKAPEVPPISNGSIRKHAAFRLPSPPVLDPDKDDLLSHDTETVFIHNRLYGRTPTQYSSDALPIDQLLDTTFVSTMPNLTNGRSTDHGQSHPIHSIPVTPPPAPPGPLFPEPNRNSPSPGLPREDALRKSISGNTMGSPKMDVPEINGCRKKSYPLPPVVAPNTSTSLQLPRPPLNKGINPKAKCTACNQELGSGDLMIISSMSLYYHLACFVCSWCGVPLSDGKSNADVRIRSNQLYCQSCFPSKHRRKTETLDNDAYKRRSASGQWTNTSSRGSTTLAFTDKRIRQRSRLTESSNFTPHGIAPKDAI